MVQTYSHCASHKKNRMVGRTKLRCCSYLKGEALDVALLLNKKVRETWTGLVQGLTAYYQSPGRLAGLRRQFAGALRHPGLDPATFATDLGMLAIQGFGDMNEQARDTMIRDKFIDGQEQCALRRQLDGFAPGTPIGEIVDSCRIWESHSDPDQNVRKRIGSESENQSGDSRSREHNRAAVVVDTREQEEVLLEEMLKFIGRSILALGQEGVLPDGMEEQSEGSGNGRGFEGLGQALGPGRRIELTQRRVPPPTVTRGLLGQCREWLEVMTNGKRIGRNSQNCNRRQTISRCIGSADPDGTGRRKSRNKHTKPTPGFMDRGMRPAKCSPTVGKGDRDVRSRVVPGAQTGTLSPLAKCFNPERITHVSQEHMENTDMDLHRSLAMTGVGETEPPCLNNIATMGLADSIETEQPVAVADVAEPGGPAVTGTGGPVEWKKKMRPAADRTGASGSRNGRTEAPVTLEFGSRSENVMPASGLAETGTGSPVGIMKERSDVDGSAEIGMRTGTETGEPVVAGRYMPRFQEGKVRRGAIVVD